ncbi:unnamed protein product, partial [Ostreobium quekettii]
MSTLTRECVLTGPGRRETAAPPRPALTHLPASGLRRPGAAGAPRRIPRPLDAVEFTADTAVGVGVAVLGLVAGLGIPIFLVKREQRDEQRIEAIRELNRDAIATTGEPLSK